MIVSHRFTKTIVVDLNYTEPFCIFYKCVLLSIHMSFCPSMCPSVHLNVLLSIHMSFCPSICPSVHPYVLLSIYIFLTDFCSWPLLTLSNNFVKCLCQMTVNQAGMPKGQEESRPKACISASNNNSICHTFIQPK